MHRRTVRFKEPFHNVNSNNQICAVERLTNELRNCYDTVAEGRQLLRELYDKLRHWKFALDGEERRSKEDCYLLSKEVDKLKHILERIAAKREDYIRQLTTAQDIIWDDRRQMESFLRSSRKVERRFRERVSFLDRFSQEPETLVSELKENSKLLSELLANLQDQLIAEEQYIRNQVEDDACSTRIKDACYSVSPRDRKSYIYGRRRVDRVDDQTTRTESPETGNHNDVRSGEHYSRSSYSGFHDNVNSDDMRSGRDDSQDLVTRDFESKNFKYDVRRDTDFDSVYRRYKRRQETGDKRSKGNDDIDPRSDVTTFGTSRRMYSDTDLSLDKGGCDTSSLSQRLRQLVKQSENVQKLITNVGSRSINSVTNGADIKHGPTGDIEKKHGTRIDDFSSFSSDVRYIDREPHVDVTNSNRRVASPERGYLRSNADENVEAFSPSEVRDKILENLEQLDQSESCCMEKRVARHAVTVQYDQKGHEQIRKELLLCLDKIFGMEKSFGTAEAEIKRLKTELEHAFREKDILERVMTKEAEELKSRLRVKCQYVDSLTGELSSARHELDEFKKARNVNESSVSETKVESEAIENDFMTMKKESEKLKERVDAKSKEVDELKKELEKAIQDIEEMRNHKCGESTSKEDIQQYKSKIISLTEENKTLRTRNDDNIAEELAALQTAIADAEEKQRRLGFENEKLIKQNEDWKTLLENYSMDISSKEEVEQRRTSTTDFQGKIEELELLLVARDAEIEYLTSNPVKELGASQMDDFIDREEQYQLELQRKEKECNELKERLKKYEELLANEGEEMGRRLDEMYENFVKSVEESSKEKEDIEQQVLSQKEDYENLLQEYIFKVNELEDQRKTLEDFPEFTDPRKQAILEAMIKSSKTEEELAEFLNNDFVDGVVTRDAGMHATEIAEENEELYKKLVRLDNEVLRRHKEVEGLKKKNRELKDEAEFLKSQQYIKNKVNEDLVNEKIKAYEKLLKAKEDECDKLKDELSKFTKDSGEKDELRKRLDKIYDKFMLADIEQENAISTERKKKEENLEGELQKRDREIGILKRSNQRFRDMLSRGSPEAIAVNESSFDFDIQEVEAAKEGFKDVDNERQRDLEEQNLDLLARITDLNEKLLGYSGVDNEYKLQSKRVRETEKRCQTLEDDNITLRERLRALQHEIKELSSVARTRKAGKITGDNLMKENEQLQERILLMGLDNEGLSDEINELKSRLHKSEYEAVDFEDQLKAASSSAEKMRQLQEENLEMEERLRDVKKKIGVVEKERKDLNEEYVKQKIKNEEDAKMFSNEIQKLKGEVIGLLGYKKASPEEVLDTSHDSLPVDEKDGGIPKFDRNRLIKKLQIENHQLAARIISLEDETTATTKIVADMERGHGHLTGVLRSHLILQKETTAKLLDNSLKQYSEEFEKVKKKFKGIEDKYDKEKKYSTRRNFAWDLFENAKATITNINAILEEGLIKVEDDLEREFSSDDDFEAKDYKSRLWILRRRLSDVEKRYRELMLRSEELSIRLDAKTTEYDVTQAELEDTIRTLEMREVLLEEIKREMSDCLQENARLKNILGQLKENQERTVGAVIAENEMLKKDLEMTSVKERVKNEEEVEKMQKRLAEAEKSRRDELNELREKLRNCEKKREDEVIGMSKKIEEETKKKDEELIEHKMKFADAEKEIDNYQRRIAELEELLRKLEASNAMLEKYLQKARSGCRSDGIDHHGTIHMLRDDLKKLFKENEELKQELESRQRKITSLAADLRKAKVAVKEQIGTDRTVDEQMLDRATKDQMMALKRRIRVLEMEKERLLKGMGIKEANQKRGMEEGSISRKESLRKARPTKKDPDTSDKTDISKISGVVSANDSTENTSTRDDTNEDIDLSFTEDLSGGVNEDIELRDKLIQELELRVRELKHELSMKHQDNQDVAARETVGDVGLAKVDPGLFADIETLKQENKHLKAQLRNLEEATNMAAGAEHGPKQKKNASAKAGTKSEAVESEIQATPLINLEAGLDFNFEGETEAADGLLESQMGRAPQFINLDMEAGGADGSTSNENAQRGRSPSRIPVSPRTKELSAKIHNKDLETTANVLSSREDLTRKVKEQEEDIKTLLQSVEYFEQETDNLRGKDEEVDNLKEKLRKSEKEVKNVNARNSKLRDQLKDSKVHDEKLKDLEDKMKKLIVENKNLEQQSKKSKSQQTEEGKKIAKEREASKKSVEELQKRLDDLRESLLEKQNILQVILSELNIDEIPSQENESVLKTIVNNAVEKKNANDQNASEGLKFANKELEETLMNAMSENGSKTLEIEELRKELTNALKENIENETNVEETRAEMKTLQAELNEAIARNAVLEVTQDVLRRLGSKLQEEGVRKELEDLESEMNVLKARNVVLEVIHDVINHVSSGLKDKEVADELRSLEVEIEARDVVLGVTQEVMNQINVQITNEAAALRNQNLIGKQDREVSLLLLQKAWEDLKDGLMKLDLISGTLAKESEAIKTRDEENSKDKKELSWLIKEMEDVSSQLEGRSMQFDEDLRRLASSEAELQDQKALNIDLEKKINEFKNVIQETNRRVKEMEVEKDNDDGIGHKFVQEQVSSLKEKIGKRDAEKVFLEELVDRQEHNTDRLTEQVRSLERQLSQTQLEVSQLTQRALESEEDLEIVKNRNEELEDDYQRLLQYGMQLDGGEVKDQEDKEDEELLIKMGETIEKLEHDKAQLEKKIEDVSFANLVQSGDKTGNLIVDVGNTSQDFERQLERSEEFEKMQDTVDKLKLEKTELEKLIEEFKFAGKDDEQRVSLAEKEEQIAELTETIYKLELDKSDLERRVKELSVADDISFESPRVAGNVAGSSSGVEKDEEVAKMEEIIYRLELDKTELEQRVTELASEEKAETQMLKQKYMISEERVTDLESELQKLSVDYRNLQANMDDVLASPRNTSDDEEISRDDDQEIFRGGPRSWKKRLVVAYRELREKSVEIATLRMIVAAKNVEVNSKRKDEAGSFEEEGESLMTDNQDKKTRDSIYLLKEEVKMKTKEIAELHEEVSTLQNSLQMNTEVEAGTVALKINGKDGNEVENDELRKEIEMLRKSLLEKEENYETLCNQLFGAEIVSNTAAVEELKTEIVELKQELGSKERKCDELESSNELLYNELVKAKADGQSDAPSEKEAGESEKRLEGLIREQEERNQIMAREFEELEEKHKDELNYASTHIGELMMKVEQLETQLQAVGKQMQEAKESSDAEAQGNWPPEGITILEGRLQRTEEELQRKNNLIANLKETVTSFYDNAEDVSETLANELKRLAKENHNLQEQLDLQKQKYELELDSMKTAMLGLKGEHVKSLKDDFERVCNDKIQLQVRLSELEEKSARQSEQINQLMSRNNDLASKIRTIDESVMFEDTGEAISLSDIPL